MEPQQQQVAQRSGRSFSRRGVCSAVVHTHPYHHHHFQIPMLPLISHNDLPAQRRLSLGSTASIISSSYRGQELAVSEL